MIWRRERNWDRTFSTYSIVAQRTLAHLGRVSRRRPAVTAECAACGAVTPCTKCADPGVGPTKFGRVVGRSIGNKLRNCLFIVGIYQVTWSSERSLRLALRS